MDQTITVEQQLAEVNRKLDLVMEEISYQRRHRQEMEDLVKDVSVIGKDIFETTVVKLDKAGVQVDYEQLANFGLKLLRNVDTFNRFLELMESADDLMKDIGPILQQAGLDAIHTLHALEQKGYFDFFRELSLVLDRIVTHFKAEDIRNLSDNIVPLLETVKNLTQPDILQAVNKSVAVYKNMDTGHIPEYSVWRMLRELNTPEMRKGIGFMITFMKNLAENSFQENEVSLKK